MLRYFRKNSRISGLVLRSYSQSGRLDTVCLAHSLRAEIAVLALTYKRSYLFVISLAFDVSLQERSWQKKAFESVQQAPYNSPLKIPILQFSYKYTGSLSGSGYPHSHTDSRCFGSALCKYHQTPPNNQDKGSGVFPQEALKGDRDIQWLLFRCRIL